MKTVGCPFHAWMFHETGSLPFTFDSSNFVDELLNRMAALGMKLEAAARVPSLMVYQMDTTMAEDFVFSWFGIVFAHDNGEHVPPDIS